MRFRSAWRLRSGVIAGSATAGRILPGKDGIRQIRNLVARNVAPQPLEIVVTPGLIAENVHNEAAEIEQSPIGGAPPFAVFRFAPEFLVQLLFDLGADGLHLGRAEPRADHEVFSKSAETAEVEHDDRGTLFVLHGLDHEAHGLGEFRQIHLYKPCLRMYSSTRAETSPWIA